jgi:type I restriction enzyme S subunit
MNSRLVKKLDDVAEFTNGGAWNQDEYVESGIPVVRVSDISDKTISLDSCKYLPSESLEKYKKHILFEGDLIIATVGSHPTQPASVVGKAAIIPNQANGALLNQNAVRIRPKNDLLDKGYLRHLGQSQFFRDYVISHARGSANQVRISIGALKRNGYSLATHLHPAQDRCHTFRL